MNKKIDYLRNETMGYGSFLEGPYGKRLITYADYTASGKHLRFLENYYMYLNESYANTHTEDDYTGKRTTELYKDAKNKIRNCVKANEDYCVFPTGTGATSAIDKLAKILGIYKTPEYMKKRQDYFDNSNFNRDEKDIINKFEDEFYSKRPVIFISSYEHHSNEIIWREAYAEVVKIDFDENGFFDLEDLRYKMGKKEYENRIKIGSFSAASNVTGIKSPVYEIAKIVHEFNGYVFFDFAASAPYVDINMTKDSESYFDGIYLSVHKFIGGPNSSGLLILKNNIYNGKNTPCFIGGGTVKYVTEKDLKYTSILEDREDAGTPGIMQVIRAAMAFEVKSLVGVEEIEKIEKNYLKRAFSFFEGVENIEILGNKDPSARIGVISFIIKHKKGYLHYGLISTLLNDLFGIQTRAGCACAGPYGIHLLNIDDGKIEWFKEAINSGMDSLKPGWTRLNFHYTLDNETFEYILQAIKFVAEHGHKFLCEYKINIEKGTWVHKSLEKDNKSSLSLSDAILSKRKKLDTKKKNYKKQYKKYLKYANEYLDLLDEDKECVLFAEKLFPNVAWFYHV